MSRTIAVRVDPELENALEERARALGCTMSDVVRQALREALAERPLGERVGDLRGSLQLGGDDDAWRRQLRARNWRR